MDGTDDDNESLEDHKAGKGKVKEKLHRHLVRFKALSSLGVRERGGMKKSITSLQSAHRIEPLTRYPIRSNDFYCLKKSVDRLPFLMLYYIWEHRKK